MTTPTEAMRLALDALTMTREQLAGDRLELIACHAWPAGSGVIPEHDRAGTQALREYDECLSSTDAAITALRDALANDGWRPIETAPKDGTEFLALKTGPLLGKCICVCTWLDADHPDYDGDTPHVSWDHSGFWDATHWMPLPAAPKD